MRIGVNTLFLIPGEVGGSETYLRRTLYAMAGLFPDVQTVLFTNRENDAFLRKDLSSFPQVKFQRLKFKSANRFARIVREQTDLPVRVKRSKIDVLWSPGYTAPFFCHCPQVTSILDMQYKRYPEDLSPIARIITHILVTAAAKRSQSILTLSEFSKKEIAQYTCASLDGIHATLLAAAPEFARHAKAAENARHVPDGRMLRKQIGSKPYILSVANTYPHKGLHTLVDAFGKLEGRIGHRLVLVGLPRRGEPKVARAIEKLADPSRVVRMAKLSVDALAALYRYAELFVFPSLYEGFGLPVLEAMMAGTPVITTKKGSIPEVGGDVAVYADPPDAQTIAEQILNVLGWNRQQRCQWVKQAALHASTFTWESTAKRTMAVLTRAAVSHRQY